MNRNPKGAAPGAGASAPQICPSPSTQAATQEGANAAKSAAKRRVGIYIAITFVLTWTLWIAGGIATDSFRTGIESPEMNAIITAGMFLPTVGALLTNLIVGKSRRIPLGLWPRLRRGSGNAKPYLAAWFVPALITVVGGALFFLVVPGSFDGNLSAITDAMANAPSSAANDFFAQSFGERPWLFVLAISGFAIALAPFVNIIPSLGEEIGWRGMLYPSLYELMSKRRAVIVGGVIWGLWHAPATIMGHNYGMDYWGWPVLGILCMCVMCVAFGTCLAWLRERTGSVWPCALAHGAFNAIVGVGLYMCAVSMPLLGPAPSGLLAGIPLIVLGFLAWRKL